MDIAPDVIRAESHVEIGALLERDANLIVERWCRIAREHQPTAKRVHQDVLRDQLPGFLKAMGRALMQAGEPDAFAHCDLAQEHGAQRWESGWSITELVCDYQLLRLVIVEHLEEHLGRDMYYRETMAIGVFIDDAVAESSARYVSHRDSESERAEREHTNALEGLSQRKDEFLAILGHELRNPLASIRNSLAIMRKVLASPHPAVATSLDVLDRQSQQLGRLVDDLLDISRIARGEFELRRSRIELQASIDQALQMCEPLIKSREHRLEVWVPETPLHLMADPNRVTQIVANLLNNAAKYTEPGGTIWLKVEFSEGDAVITIRDTGIGIAPEMLGRVFELFARVESQTTIREGLGIGLTLVQRLVEQHGGSITAHSEGLGLGAEFVVRLPAEPDAAASLRPTTESEPLLVIKQVRKDH